MQRLHVRSIFLSDIHLGTRDCRADFLLSFLRETRGDSLYLVGDIVDLEALEHSAYWPASHGAIVAEFLAIAAGGTAVTWIPGNHDAAMRGLAGQRIGAIAVELEAIHTSADGRRFRVSHGDEFDPEHHGRWSTRFGAACYHVLCTLNRACNAWRRRFGLPYVALSILAKSRIGRALAYIRRFQALATSRARELGLDGQICGHIHYGAIERIDGVLYMNDGDWVEHCTALVEHHDGTFELLHWSERRAALARNDAGAAAPRPLDLPAWARALHAPA